MKKLEKASKSTIVYLSHGGGPLPLLGDQGHKEMVDCLQEIATSIPKPSAILLISAHWEERIPTITAAQTPALIYDYYGFSSQAYQIKYPAPGDPVLAKKIITCFSETHVEAVLDAQRGYDHGLFVPLKIMYPQATIPCLQLSLVEGLDPLVHIKMGEVLAKINHENLLIIGSGFSFHNLQAFFAPASAELQLKNELFESWLVDTCSNPLMDETERTRRLVNWDQAPSARYCHPREEHLVPLHVCYGAAKRECRKVFKLKIMGRQTSMFLW